MSICAVWVNGNKLHTGPAAEDAAPLPVRDAAGELLAAPDHTQIVVDDRCVNLQILRHMLVVGGRLHNRRLTQWQ